MILSANKNILNCVFEIKDEKRVVDFIIDNSLRTVLGFEAKKYSNFGFYESENILKDFKRQFHPYPLRYH